MITREKENEKRGSCHNLPVWHLNCYVRHFKQSLGEKIIQLLPNDDATYMELYSTFLVASIV